MLVKTPSQASLIAVVGSTHTIHWATRNQVGRLWPLCAIGGDMAIARDDAATCTNCTKIAEHPEALATRSDTVREWR